MTIQLIPLEQIYENTYNPRSHYDPAKIKELANSIRQNGLLEVPKARKNAVDTYEMAYGGYRLRAFKEISNNLTSIPPQTIEKYILDGKLAMPLDIEEISDTSMAIFALEENLKRQNLTPMDTANAIAKYFELFPATREEDLAVKLSLTQSTISNMRRVTRLPKEVLKYIDDETISFTQGRELCMLSDIDGLTKGKTESKLLMVDAIALIGTEGIPTTVAGMKKAIHRVIHGTFLSLDPGAATNVAVFETGECIRCEKAFKTTDDAGKTSLHCIDPECWNLKQRTALRVKEEADATAKEADRAAKEKVDQEAAEKQWKKDATADKVVTAPKYTAIVVEASRLDAGGDIFESYKALQNTVGGTDMSVPPAIEGTDFYVSAGDFAEIPGAKQAYRLVLRPEFKGEIRILKPNEGESEADWRARIKADPNGPLNGVVARWQKEEYVLNGPPVVFTPMVESAPPPERAKPVPPAITKKEVTIDEGKKPVEEPEEHEAAGAVAGTVTAAALKEVPETFPAGTSRYSVTCTLDVVIIDDVGLDREMTETRAIATFIDRVKYGTVGTLDRTLFTVKKKK